MPSERLREAIDEDATALSIVSALVMTVAAAGLMRSKDDLVLTEKPQVCMFVASMTISAASGLTSVAIGTFTYMHGKKVTDENFFDYATSIKGKFWGEAVVYNTISVYALVIGIGFSVFLNFGFTEFLVCLGVCIPFVGVLILSSIKINDACVRQLNLQSVQPTIAMADIYGNGERIDGASVARLRLQ